MYILSTVLRNVVREFSHWLPCQLLACGIWRPVVWYFISVFWKYRRRSASFRLLRLWVEYGRGHGSLSVVSVVCCQVEVSGASWSLVQRSPIECCASLCVIKKLQNGEAMARFGPRHHKKKIGRTFWHDPHFGIVRSHVPLSSVCT